MTKRPEGDLRLTILQICFFLAAFAVIFKLFYIQVIKHKDYSAKAFDQHWDSRVLSSRRGDILASDGYPLATSNVSYLVFVEPKKVTDADKYSLSLAQILNEDKNVLGVPELKEKILSDFFWVPVKNRVSEQQKSKIEELKLAGVGFEEEPQRIYPENSLASHVLGFVAGSDSEGDKGYFGVEGYFNGDLRGKEGRILEERGASGASILIGGYKKIEPKNGRSLLLTINRELQYLVEGKLKDGVEKFEAKSASAVILDPITGDILAMANYPTFEPRDPFKEPNESTKSQKVQRKNLTIEEVYEPGSIIKPLTISTAIDLGLITDKSTFDDKGPVMYSGHTIDNWNGKHHGIQTVTEILEKSNNIGAAWVGTKVGSDKLYEYFDRYGLGELTKITLEGENTGMLRDPSEWTDIDLATASFGQGISASLLQMGLAFSVFENGGFLVKPRIVSKIIDEKRTIEVEPEKKNRVISTQTANTVSRMLVSAVEKGEAKFFNMPGYTIAGKTGTAQIAVGNKYDLEKTNATFVGFLPNVPSDKKFVMIVKIEEPQSSIYAAETAVPLWMDILRELVVLMQIPPDKL